MLIIALIALIAVVCIIFLSLPALVVGGSLFSAFAVASYDTTKDTFPLLAFLDKCLNPNGVVAVISMLAVSALLVVYWSEMVGIMKGVLFSSLIYMFYGDIRIFYLLVPVFVLCGFMDKDGRNKERYFKSIDNFDKFRTFINVLIVMLFILLVVSHGLKGIAANALIKIFKTGPNEYDIIQNDAALVSIFSLLLIIPSTIKKCTYNKSHAVKECNIKFGFAVCIIKLVALAVTVLSLLIHITDVEKKYIYLLDVDLPVGAFLCIGVCIFSIIYTVNLLDDDYMRRRDYDDYKLQKQKEEEQRQQQTTAPVHSNEYVFRNIFYQDEKALYDDRIYARQTGKSFEETECNLGDWGEYQVSLELERYFTERIPYNMLFSVCLFKDKNFTATNEMDILFITGFGIYVIEVKNKNVYWDIDGSNENSEDMQKDVHTNPFYQNKQHIKTLKNFLKENGLSKWNDDIYNVVAFAERTISIDGIKNINDAIYGMYNEIPLFIERTFIGRTPKFTEEDIKNITRPLSVYENNRAMNDMHLDYVKQFEK